MRLFAFRLQFLVVGVCLASGLCVWARDTRYVERVYLAPAAAEVVVPTSYVPTSYLRTSYVPTSYFPTSYGSAAYVETDTYFLPTSRVVPSYYPTSYFAESAVLPTTTVYETQYRRSLIGSLLFGRRRLVERSVVSSYPAVYTPTSLVFPSYYPTASYSPREFAPTVYDTNVAWNSAPVCCGEVVSGYRAPSSQAAPVIDSGRTASSSAKSAENSAMEESIPSYVQPSRPDPTPADLSPADETTKVNSGASTLADDPASPPQVPPAKPAPIANGTVQGQPSLTQPAPIKDAAKPVEKSKIAAPKAPAGDLPVDDGVEAAPKGASNRAAERRVVVAKPINPLSAIRPERRNVLFGKVESSVAGQPEEEVRVIVASRSNRGIRKEGMSDAYGRFAIKLSDGEWTVNVAMPSGRIYPVSQITVMDGRIIDQREGREVPSLIITR